MGLGNAFKTAMAHGHCGHWQGQLLSLHADKLTDTVAAFLLSSNEVSSLSKCFFLAKQDSIQLYASGAGMDRDHTQI